MRELISRRTAGFDVSISLTDSGSILLNAATENAKRVAVIPPEKALEAFLHPCLFVDNPSEFFAKKESEKSL